MIDEVAHEMFEHLPDDELVGAHMREASPIHSNYFKLQVGMSSRLAPFPSHGEGGGRLEPTLADAAIAGRFALAVLLGFFVGLEREYRGKAAGMRTFALIALGAAAFTSIAIARFPISGDRVIQGVVAGIGFLGAGIIFQ